MLVHWPIFPMSDRAIELEKLVSEIRACQHCVDLMPHKPRPVLQVSAQARIAVIAQAPGTKVHKSGKPFTDASGDRLREWMGVDEDVFYDASRIAILPMGFCFPGLDEKGGDLPPLKQCAERWRPSLMDLLPQFELILLVGGYAQKWHLGKSVQKSLTLTVAQWRDYGPIFMPTPHPSWRNSGWLKKNRWFEEELLPVMRARIQENL